MTNVRFNFVESSSPAAVEYTENHYQKGIYISQRNKKMANYIIAGHMKCVVW